MPKSVRFSDITEIDEDGMITTVPDIAEEKEP